MSAHTWSFCYTWKIKNCVIFKKNIYKYNIGNIGKIIKKIYRICYNM